MTHDNFGAILAVIGYGFCVTAMFGVDWRLGAFSLGVIFLGLGWSSFKVGERKKKQPPSNQP